MDVRKNTDKSLTMVSQDITEKKLGRFYHNAKNKYKGRNNT